MLSKTEIIRAAKKIGELIKKSHFIYFLTSGDEVVYVGKSTKGFTRLFTHIDLATRPEKYTRYKKDFDGFHYISCRADEIQDLEAAYIIALNPKYNKMVPENSRYKPLYALGRKYGLPNKTIQFIVRRYNLNVVRGTHVEGDAFKKALEKYKKESKK